MPESVKRNILPVVFRDVLFAIMISLLVILVILLLMVKPVKKNDSETKSAGDIIVEVYWPDERRVDVDVFVMGPDNEVVGFPHKRGRIFSLLRDDLGAEDDFSGKNYEFVYGRGIMDGEYVVSVLYYANKDGGEPKPVDVRIIVKIRAEYGFVVIYKGTRKLFAPSYEIGVVRFWVKKKRLDKVEEIWEKDVLFWNRLSGGRE